MLEMSIIHTNRMVHERVGTEAMCVIMRGLPALRRARYTDGKWI